MRNEEGADGILMSWTSFFCGFFMPEDRSTNCIGKNSKGVSDSSQEAPIPFGGMGTSR